MLQPDWAPRARQGFRLWAWPLYRTKEELVSGFEFVLELGECAYRTKDGRWFEAKCLVVARGWVVIHGRSS